MSAAFSMIDLTPFLAVETSSNGGIVTQIASEFNVNWSRLISQFILFGLVLSMLRKLVYGPAEKMLDERRRIIDETLANSEKARQELADTASAKREILKQAELQAAQVVKDAQSAADGVIKRAQAAAVQEAEQIVSKARAAAQIEHAQMQADLRKEITRLVAEVSQKVTGRILTAEDHQRLNEATITQVARN